MKLTYLFVLLASLTFFVTSCDNDLELFDEWKDIPVVYALLSKSDTAHYVRVEKAFLDQNVDAATIAQIPDSLYYGEDEIDVRVKNLDSDVEYTLSRVDGALEGYPRSPDGPFATSPNYLYKFTLPPGETLIGSVNYQIILDRGEGTELITGQDRLVNDILIEEPDDVWALRYGRTAEIEWQSDSDAAIFDVSIIFNFREMDGQGNFEDKSIRWFVTSNLLREEDRNAFDITAEFIGESFFASVGERIDGSIPRTRTFKSVEVRVDAGGSELRQYISVVQANTGITSAEIIPNYTNMSEGFGIFSSRNVGTKTGIQLDAVARDSLRNGIYTRDLNFQ